MKLFFMGMLALCLAGCNKAPFSFATAKPASGDTKLKLIQTIPLQNVEGRIDHLSVDLKGQRLFVAALGNNTVEVLDLITGKAIRTISNLSEPQSALFISVINKIFITNGDNGVCQIFDGDSFTELSRVQLSGDADNVRYDSKSAAVIVGYGNGGLSFIDPSSGQVIEDIILDGHPESFQLESDGSKIFVNIPSADEIAIIDRKQQEVVAAWLMTSALANFPMTLDDPNHRLFVGFRVPSKLVVFDTETGKPVADFSIVGDVDDIFYDGIHKLIFVIGGEGYVEEFSQQDADHYQRLARVSTGEGARTGLWVADWNRLYVAVPHKGNQPAEIQVYELQP